MRSQNAYNRSQSRYSLKDTVPWQRTCQRKDSYDTREEAEAVLDRFILPPITLWSYKCWRCGKFHLGNNRRKDSTR